MIGTSCVTISMIDSTFFYYFYELQYLYYYFYY